MNFDPSLSSAPPAEPTARADRMLSPGQRSTIGLTGAVLLGLLAVARVLAPSPNGLGTHQQLGLPPCTMVALFGVRCPACGMTTSWAYFTRGQVADSLRVNAGGTLLALAATVFGPWLAISAYRGRYLIGPPNEYLVLAISVLIAIVTAGDWLLRTGWWG